MLCRYFNLIVAYFFTHYQLPTSFVLQKVWVHTMGCILSKFIVPELGPIPDAMVVLRHASSFLMQFRMHKWTKLKAWMWTHVVHSIMVAKRKGSWGIMMYHWKKGDRGYLICFCLCLLNMISIWHHKSPEPMVIVLYYFSGFLSSLCLSLSPSLPECMCVYGLLRHQHNILDGRKFWGGNILQCMGIWCFPHWLINCQFNPFKVNLQAVQTVLIVC